MDRLEELKTKYQTVLKAIQDKGVRLANLHLQDNKLFVRAAAPSQAVKNQIWDLIKIINPKYDDITADITIDQNLAPKAAPAPPPPKTYTVLAGDTLSKISKHFYGDATKYMKIFEANRDKLSNPDLIKVGQVLTIPD
ncbi:MAG: LysM peptidoglycan-binding domain-containing protein [Acidobacteria bacterium]|nr:LysM peptidoglycan-binding domain-containing protein [Acidobacteriota bacterium]